MFIKHSLGKGDRFQEKECRDIAAILRFAREMGCFKAGGRRQKAEGRRQKAKGKRQKE